MQNLRSGGQSWTTVEEALSLLDDDPDVLAESRLARHVGADGCRASGTRCRPPADVFHQPGLLGYPDSLSVARLQHAHGGAHRPEAASFCSMRGALWPSCSCTPVPTSAG